MKAVILAGGYGTRLAEETEVKPKPMVEVGGKPLIWHIMKTYSAHGINDFVICLGYKGYVLKEYFSNYFLHNSNVTFDMTNNSMHVHEQKAEPWRVTLVDTGDKTMTGGRLKRISDFVKDEPCFCLTYGDGVSDVDITALVKFHNAQKRLATVTGVQPPGRFGAIVAEGEKVKGFIEKPMGDGNWINGGYFVLSPKVLDFISEDSSIWETDVMPALAQKNQMAIYRHQGFWQPVDTLREKRFLQQLWREGNAAWKVW